MVENRVPVNSRWLSLLETTTPTCNSMSYLSYIEADYANMHTNELPIFVYNLWMIMPVIVFSCQHYDVQQYQTLSGIHCTISEW